MIWLFFRPVYSEFIDVCIGTFTSVEQTLYTDGLSLNTRATEIPGSLAPALLGTRFSDGDVFIVGFILIR